MDREAIARLRRAFEAGFAASGEGWNGEHNTADSNTEFAEWISEAFASWYNETADAPALTPPPGAPPNPQEGEGWKLVPVEPTPAMRVAASAFVPIHRPKIAEAYRAMIAASPPAPVSGWRDIATAPKDGTDVLLAGAVPEGWRVTVGHWTTDEECRTPIGDCGGECRCIEYDYHDPAWISWDGGFCDPWPATHWQPLTTPKGDDHG